MKMLATEFPVKIHFGKVEFIEFIINWLHKSDYSTVIDPKLTTEIDKDNFILESETGESLRFRYLELTNGTVALGFRHDVPDDKGRIWRTEAVLRHNTPPDSLLRIRTQCIATQHGAQLHIPKKPYLIKLILQNAWGGLDGKLTVCDYPIYLQDSEEDIERAISSFRGELSRFLPIIYMSAPTTNGYTTTRREIEEFAYSLGGIAHILVEPNMDFSRKIYDKIKQKTIYGGNIGIIMPHTGIIKNIYIKNNIRDKLIYAENYTKETKTQMPATCWDWTELQDISLRTQREKEKLLLSREELEEMYEKECVNLRDNIADLKYTIEHITSSNTNYRHKDERDADIISSLGNEIYSGEFLDRFRFIAHFLTREIDNGKIDARTHALLAHIYSLLAPSSGLRELKNNIKSATRDKRNVADELRGLLVRHGYHYKSNNGHLRLEPKEGFEGLKSITIPSTPSESRGLNNLRSQIESALGITYLDE